MLAGTGGRHRAAGQPEGSQRDDPASNAMKKRPPHDRGGRSLGAVGWRFLFGAACHGVGAVRLGCRETCPQRLGEIIRVFAFRQGRIDVESHAVPDWHAPNLRAARPLGQTWMSRTEVPP